MGLPRATLTQLMPECFFLFELGSHRTPLFLLLVFLYFRSLLSGGHTFQKISRATFFPGHWLIEQTLGITFRVVDFVQDSMY